MNNFYESTAIFLRPDEEKVTAKVYLVDADNPAEAHFNLSRFLAEEEVMEYSHPKTTQISFDEILTPEDFKEEIYFWYEAKAKLKEGTKSNGEPQYTTYRFLIADFNQKSANDQLIKHLGTYKCDWRITSIKEKFLTDILLRKLCCEKCDMCEFNTQIVSFDDQRIVDARLYNVTEAKAAQMQLAIELGAEKVQRKKYSVKATKIKLISLIGQELASKVLREWVEDFVDEDTTEVVSIERKEIVLRSGTIIDHNSIEIILAAKVKEVWIKL